MFVLGFILKSVNRSFEQFLTSYVFYNVLKVTFSSKKGFKFNVNVLLITSIIMILVPVNSY